MTGPLPHRLSHPHFSLPLTATGSLFYNPYRLINNQQGIHAYGAPITQTGYGRRRRDAGYDSAHGGAVVHDLRLWRRFDAPHGWRLRFGAASALLTAPRPLCASRDDGSALPLWPCCS